MIHPFFESRNNQLYYIIAWLFIAILHVGAVFYISGQEFQLALVDSLVFNTLLFFISLSLWYLVRFSSLREKGVFNFIFYHFSSLVVTITIWLSGGYFLLNMLMAIQPDYLNFLNSSMPWRVVSGILTYCVVILIYYLVIYYLDLQEKLHKEAELHGLVKEAEINVLKSQINPHFLFNSLNSISSLTITKPEKAREMVVKLSEFLRYSLDQDMKETNSLDAELKNIALYLDIEKVRFGARLIYENSIDPLALKAHIPNLLLQPIYENAIKHGVYESIEPILIKTEARKIGSELEVCISNDFDPKAHVRKGKGIGLKNIQERLILIYERDDLLSVKKLLNKFEVRIKIPQRYE